MKYNISDNYIEHEMNGEKFLLKVQDEDVQYPKLYILNQTSYDIYSFVKKNSGVNDEEIYNELLDKYPNNRESIFIDDIKECIIDFLTIGIFEKKDE